MVGRTNANGIEAQVLHVIVLGGAYETITYTGTVNGSATLNTNGEVSLALPYGSYTFTAGLSGLSITKMATPGAVIRLRPEKFIYWYGIENGNPTLSPDTRGTVTRNTNSLRFACTDNRAYHALVSDVDPSGDSKVTLKTTAVNAGGNWCFLMNESGISPPNSGQWVRITAAGTAALSYTYASTRQIKVSLYANASGYYCEFTEWYFGDREAA